MFSMLCSLSAGPVPISGPCRRYMHGRGLSNEMPSPVTAEEGKGKAVLAIYTVKKGVISAVHY